MTDEELANLELEQRPHVVILGAGASRAAFPEGDRNSRTIPLMNDLVPQIGLTELMDSNRIEWRNRSFEEIYGDLRSDGSYQQVVDSVEAHIRTYFDNLQLPTHPCLYDHLLFSLRGKDVIATFNWDPFLMDAYRRNINVKGLPRILFLHGCVRAGCCEVHGTAGWLGYSCKSCGAPLKPVPLLLPIKNKNYTDDKFIEKQWYHLRIALRSALILTVFGYAAPVSDEKAISTMKGAWKAGETQIEQVELINIAPREELLKSWKEFFTRDHYNVTKTFYESWCGRHPRRSCEAFWDQFMDIQIRTNNAVPRDANFPQLLDWFGPLFNAEKAAGLQD